MNPWVVFVSVCFRVCVCICMWFCVFACVSVCLRNVCLCVCLYVSACVFICACLCVCVCLCVCICHCGWCICLFGICLWVYLCVSALCPCTDVGASLGVTFRRRSLPVNVYTPVTHSGQWYPVELSLVVGFVHATQHQDTAVHPASVERRKRVIFGGQ